jgi:ADP-ribosylglycohydrolase
MERETVGLRERIEGGLWGLLIGDALGVPYEFKRPDELPPPEAIELEAERPSHRVPPGTWSDDGAQALCLLESLLACGGVDLDDLGARLVRWFADGHFAVDGVVFDVGIQTTEALRAIQRGVPARDAARRDERANGNGALMRVLPVALFHAARAGTGLHEPAIDAAVARDADASSIPTHAHPRSRAACVLYSLWALQALRGEADLERAFAAAVQAARAHTRGEVRDELDGALTQGPLVLSGSGYVVHTLHAARACARAASYEAAVRAAIRLGEDTDTNACVVGGLVGVRDGVRAIPARWRRGLRGQELFAPLVAALLRG